MRRKCSKNDDRHPYMNPMKWIDGTLCFWRDNPGMYSKETIKRFESWVQDMRKDRTFIETSIFTKTNISE